MNSIQDILKKLPHRPPFLLIDRIIEIDLEKKTVKALKNVTINEPFFAGHFPQKPVMPGVLIVEALAQACAFLGAETWSKPTTTDIGLFLLAGIEKTRFKRIVEPGDQLILEARITSDRHHLLKCEARASVNGETVCTTTLTSMRKEIEL